MSYAPLLLSLEVATIAIIVATVLGVAIGATLATHRFWGRDAVDVLLTTPMILPPTVLGYYVLTALGRTSVDSIAIGTPPQVNFVKYTPIPLSSGAGSTGSGRWPVWVRWTALTHGTGIT